MGGKTTWRIGLGPVFAYERIAASRRWQGYALRSLFASALLVGASLRVEQHSAGNDRFHHSVPCRARQGAFSWLWSARSSRS